MISFEQWYKELTSDEIWLDAMRYQHKGKDLKQVALILYGAGAADASNFLSVPMSEHRKHLHYKALKMQPGDFKQVGVSLQQTVKEDPKKEEDFLTGEARAAKLKEWKEMLMKTPPLKPVQKMSTREVLEEGDWEPKRHVNYVPAVDASLLRLKQAITRFASRKYKSRHSFYDFKTYKFGLVEIVAENDTDAKEILKKAERYCKLKNINL